MNRTELLPWDTAFFEFPVARITCAEVDCGELKRAVAELRANSIRLGYWAPIHPSPEVIELAVKLGGRLVDIKLTYLAECHAAPVNESLPLDRVEAYRPEMALGDLEELALESAIYSRFVVDPQFPRDKADALFRQWARGSIAAETAGAVLAIRDGSQVVGLVTLDAQSNRARIGLLAVRATHRGRKYAQALVQSARAWCRRNALEHCQVVTQEANVPARNLYQRCGFVLSRTEHFFHFWLS